MTSPRLAFYLSVLLACFYFIAPAHGAELEPPLMMKKPMLAGADIYDVNACNIDGLALSGVDVVSYHTPTGPLVGNPEFTKNYNELTYRFISQAHADQFAAAPQKYLPSYLGWCATSLAVGALTCPNPLNYKLENGQLLLFETTGFTNGQDLWNADPQDYRRRADRNRDKFISSKTPSDGTPGR